MKNRPIENYETNRLDFDPQNPRFGRTFENNIQEPDLVLRKMIKSENLQELMESIGEQNYFSGEPLLIAPNKDKESKDRFIVVEGNRRLAALKLLNGELEPTPPLPSILEIKAKATHTPLEVPCIFFDDRKDILQYLGYRHVTGAKRWDSLSKAIYIQQLQTEFFGKDDLDTQCKEIARTIGSRKDYVAQMLTGLRVYSHAQRSEFFGLQRVREDDVNFSVLTTALSYTNIAQYVGLKDRQDILAEELKDEHLRDVLSWIFAQDEAGETILGESRNLKKLAAVVDSDSAVKVLRETKNLEAAYLRTEGPAVSFTGALNEAYAALRTAHELLPTVEKFGLEHRKALERISDLSSDIDLLVQKALRKQAKEDIVDE